jgi:hypothetical protein
VYVLTDVKLTFAQPPMIAVLDKFGVYVLRDVELTLAQPPMIHY